MRIVCLLLAGVVCAFAQAPPQTVLKADPLLVTNCQDGFGKATLTWSALTGPVQVRVGDENGPALTGWVPGQGSGDTGYWVTDGMSFVLMLQNYDHPIARAVVRTDCGGTGDATVAGLMATNGFLPLQLGNRWVFRTDNRAETSGYVTWTVVRNDYALNQLWFVIDVRSGHLDSGAVEMWVRTDADGRIYRYDTYFHTESLWLDPTSQYQSALQVTGTGLNLDTAFGTFPGGLQYQGSEAALLMSTGSFEQGLGQINDSATMLSGSSGGFYASRDLLDARVGDGLVFTTSSVSVSLGAESLRLDVTGKNVKNCAIPCYFVACGIAGADPPGTWKPCFQARVRVGASSCPVAKILNADVELRDASDHAVYQRTIDVAVPPRSCEGAAYHQVRLYSEPNHGLSPGQYRLWVSVRDGTTESGSASLPIRID